jgi:serine/threonine-protein kinase HipA
MTKESTFELTGSSRSLNIYINDDLIGTLIEDNDIWALVYEEPWVLKEGSFDLSPALPRSQLFHRDGATMRPVQWYFDNLLPEEKLREQIALDASLRDKDDAFALLEYLGVESAGAMILLPPGQTPERHAALKPLTYSELSRRISNLPTTTLTKEAPKRMSLAGAQHKLLVVLKGDELYEPVSGTPSTHILKPDHPDKQTYPASTYLEWLTMRLAMAARMEVPSVRLLTVPEPVYVIERFDRRFAPKELASQSGSELADVERLHIIDACQLLNKSRVYKYAGASVQTLREIALACSDELTLPPRLFRWLVFNLLVANDDCHLKNLSFLVSPSRLDLSPHYDLLATGVYHTRAFADERATWPAVPLAVRLSESVTRFDQVTPESILRAGEELGLPAPVATRIIKDVIQRTLREFDVIFASHYPEEPTLAQPKGRPGPRVSKQPALFDEAVALSNEGKTTDAVSPQVLAQQLKILRVLRFVVLPEMAKRLI